MILYERAELLRQLTSLHRSARRGQGRLVLLSGEAGIGKSSLVDAFCEDLAEPGLVVRGWCDAITPPRAFGPLADIAEAVGGALAGALAASDRDFVLHSFLALLRRRPLVVVLEDLQWADDATLDLLRVVGRRLSATSVLMIGTFRDDEVGDDHPLRLALGDLPARVMAEIELPALTTAAIEAMAAGTDVDPAALHAVTAGNPFFATEVLAAGTARVPHTVRDAVLARASRLSESAREALRAASVLGPRWEPELLRRVADCDDRPIDECRSRGVLCDDDGMLRFRHELAQRALAEVLAPADRLTLNATALAVLRSGSVTVDPSRLARHAVDAEEADAVLEFAPLAGERAAALGAHREAAAHFEAALRVADGADARRRAELLEAFAREARIIDRVGDAIESQSEAIAHWHRLNDARREGDALQALSLMLWLGGQSEDALAMAERAVRLLEAIAPHGPELARACAALAQRLATAGIDERAQAVAGRALRLAARIGDERVAVHALTTIGLSEAYQGVEAGWEKLEESAARAKAAGLEEDAARALINLVESGRGLRRFDRADRYTEEALAYVIDHDLDLYRRRLWGVLAELALERGRWDEAAGRAGALARESRVAPVIRARALTVLGCLAARRGDGNPWASLDEAVALVGATGESQDLCPIYAARSEAAWLQGDRDRASEEARRGLARAVQQPIDEWWLGEAGFWAWRAGVVERLPDGSAQPYVLHAQGRHREAARSWRRLGCPYHEAQALADSSEEADLRDSLALSHSLGALPLARIATTRLHASGAARIARGPRRSTRRNPFSLTDRELEVMVLLSDGLSNAEIAKRLVVSPKTVEHHVAAVLRKSGVKDRMAAGREAKRLARKDGEVAETT